MKSVFATKTENGFTLYSSLEKAKIGLKEEIKTLFSKVEDEFYYKWGNFVTTYELLDYKLTQVEEKLVAYAKWVTHHTLNGEPIENKDEHYKTIKERSEDGWREVGWIKEKEIL